MNINSDIVGYKMKERTYRLTTRETKNYAASVFDANTVYYDDLNIRELKAHPMIAAKLTWRLFEDFHVEDHFPISKKIFSTMVHYKERIDIVRLIKPEEAVRVKGVIQGVFPSNNNSIVVIKVEVLSDHQKELIHTEFLTILLRGVNCTDEGKQSGEIPTISSKNIEVSKIQKEIFIPYEAPYLYDAAADIHFGIHTSKQIAKQAGFSNIIMQGTAILAYSVRELINMEGQKNPDSLNVIAGSFTDVIYPNSTMTLHIHEIENIGNVKNVWFSVENETGKTAVQDGYVRFLFNK